MTDELVARGLARSRSHAQSLIVAGQVTVDDQPATKASGLVYSTTSIDATTDRYVSRAAQKLLGALDDLEVAVPARALDAGASTGGFTQVLLERGCREVVAVDVGTGQLATALRDDPRVEVRERTNVRDLRLADLGGRPVDLVVADLSFISLTLVIDALNAVTSATGRLLLMVKPQFEVGRERLGTRWRRPVARTASAGGADGDRRRGSGGLERPRRRREPVARHRRQPRVLRGLRPGSAGSGGRPRWPRWH